MQTNQKFNVLCVTRRWKDGSGHPLWHTPLIGIAEVLTKGEIVKTELGVNLANETIVRFNGRTGKLHYVRDGLDSSAVIIAMEISNDDEFPCDLWELYTDTPTNKKVKPAALHKAAAWAIESNIHDNQRTREIAVLRRSRGW